MRHIIAIMLSVFMTGYKGKTVDFTRASDFPVVSYFLCDSWRKTVFCYRYEGALNDMENAVVLITYPKNAFGDGKAFSLSNYAP